MDETINYYDKNAASFEADTLSADMSESQGRFIALLAHKSYLLDFGCGAGRDSLFFLEKGFLVDAVDGSEAMCNVAKRNIHQPVKRMAFDQLDEVGKYDGIWACASLLHVPKIDLPCILKLVHRALKKDGIFYMSVKEGTFEGIRNGRYFSDYLAKEIKDILMGSGFVILESWVSQDVRSSRDDQWINLISKRKTVVFSDPK